MVKPEYLVQIALHGGNGLEIITSKENAEKALEAALHEPVNLSIEGITSLGGETRSIVRVSEIQQISIIQKVQPEPGMAGTPQKSPLLVPRL